MLVAPTAAWASYGGCTKSYPCSLAFTTDGQPTGTTVNTKITSSFDAPDAGPVKVEVLDASGQLVTNSKAAVTVAITSTANPGSGTLSGTTTVNASGGVASFSDLSINQPGIGYRLTATGYGMNPGDIGPLHDLGIAPAMLDHTVLGVSIVGDDVGDSHDLLCCLDPVPRDRDRRRQLQLRRDLPAGVGSV